nr:MAG TPA: hypothetical protein [Caudoviricetes sp.]
MEHMRFEPAHGTKTSLVLGSLTDFRLSVTFEPFPASQTKKGLKGERVKRTLNAAGKGA